jgi:hypothetical protein
LTIRKKGEVKVEGVVEEPLEAEMRMRRRMKMWVLAVTRRMITSTYLVIKTMVIKEVEDKEDLGKDLEEVVLEELVSSVVKKSIGPMNVHNTKEGQTEGQKVVQGLHMQMRKLNLSIQMMLKGEKP